MKFFYQKRTCRDVVHLSHDLTFAAHMHEAVEIVYMIEGTAHAFSGGKDCTLSPGDFFVAFPNLVHYYDNCSDNLAIVAIVPLEMLPEFRSILTSRSLVSPLVKGVNPQAGKFLESVLVYKGTYQEEAVRGLILAAFAMIMEKISLSSENISEESTLSSILEFCENNYTGEISLDILSDKLGISKSHISHIFSNKIHMNFRDYVNSLRLSRALQLLKEGKYSMTEISSESGFETIRTFNRAFKKRFNTSPIEYRKQFS